MDHLDGTFDPLYSALSTFFSPTIFGVGKVQYDLQHIISLPVNMAVLGILQHIREAPLNHTTSEGRTSH